MASLLGMHAEGDLQVLMDVGLSETVGLSVNELKQRMKDVPELQIEVNILKAERDQSKKIMTNEVIDLRREIEKLHDTVDYLKGRYRDRENDEVAAEEPDEEEPGIALEDQLRITEQSAKAIDLLSNHLLATVWQTCSKNTFGKCSFYSTFVCEKLTAQLLCRILHPNHVALWISIQETAYPRDCFSHYSRLVNRPLFGGYANHPCILPMD
jgi:hypothetical protein